MSKREPMNVYVVTKQEATDCYKRAHINSDTIGTFRSKKAAVKAAAKAYREEYQEYCLGALELFAKDSPRRKAAEEWEELHSGKKPKHSEVLEFFEEWGSEIWKPEFISEQTFCVDITKSEVTGRQFGGKEQKQVCKRKSSTMHVVTKLEVESISREYGSLILADVIGVYRKEKDAVKAAARAYEEAYFEGLHDDEPDDFEEGSLRRKAAEQGAELYSGKKPKHSEVLEFFEEWGHEIWQLNDDSVISNEPSFAVEIYKREVK